MRKRLDTRFPAARIKKIMQTDEDVGKIALAVPLLVSKALELFLQDLCDRTYEITLKRGAKTLNSLHLKQCVQTFNVFDFLREIVSKVPDLGGSESTGDDRSVIKRRRLADEENNDSDEEPSKNRVHEAAHASGSGRGRARGRGRGRGRGSRAVDKHEKCEDDPDGLVDNGKHSPSSERQDDSDELINLKQNVSARKEEQTQTPVHDFDLNLDLDEDGNVVSTDAHASSLENPTPEVKHEELPAKPAIEVKHEELPKKPAPEVGHEELPGWSLSYIEKMDIDPLHLANFNRRMDEDEEDYDEE